MFERKSIEKQTDLEIIGLFYIVQAKNVFISFFISHKGKHFNSFLCHDLVMLFKIMNYSYCHMKFIMKGLFLLSVLALYSFPGINLK